MFSAWRRRMLEGAISKAMSVEVVAERDLAKDEGMYCGGSVGNWLF